MAQPIAPEIWQEGIEDNTLLPGRYTTGLFTGSGVNIANNGEAQRIWDMQISDYITDYDDRRLNGLANVEGATNFNQDGRDGWGASAYGVFQDVRFDSRIYTMGRHRSIAMRIYDEQQYSGGIGQWGDATTSNIMTNGQSLMKAAQIVSKAKDLWQKQVLGPDIDKYNLFAVFNGHISGRWVPNPEYVDRVCDGDASHGTWIAQPGMVQGQAIPPRFAPIHGIEWDDDNIPMMLNTIKVTWNNIFLPQDNRVIIIDPNYEYRLLTALTGKGLPATDSAYADLQNGSFTRLMGWDFNFEIPTMYFPKLYFDDNYNVVHSADGKAAYDAVLNSVAGMEGDNKLLTELIASNRMSQNNYVRTVWNNETKQFEKKVTNYPLGSPVASPYYGDAVEVNGGWDKPDTYPFAGPGMGYGLDHPTGPVGTPTLRQVIGAAIYKPAAQLSQEYSEMVTDEGRTRGKFTEIAMDVKYDAWVIERYSHGILPIVASTENSGTTAAIPVQLVDNSTDEAAA